MSPRAKRTEYSVAVERSGRGTAEGGSPLELAEEWTPEHLLLLALAHCSLTSLRYHARRSELDFVASVTAAGAVAEREDGSWGFVEIGCEIDVELDPVPPADELNPLLRRAERGCFIGASLAPKPRYGWRVNGSDVD